jgi:hypothetical protein
MHAGWHGLLFDTRCDGIAKVFIIENNLAEKCDFVAFFFRATPKRQAKRKIFRL